MKIYMPIKPTMEDLVAACWLAHSKNDGLLPEVEFVGSSTELCIDASKGLFAIGLFPPHSFSLSCLSEAEYNAVLAQPSVLEFMYEAIWHRWLKGDPTPLPSKQVFNAFFSWFNTYALPYLLENSK